MNKGLLLVLGLVILLPAPGHAAQNQSGSPSAQAGQRKGSIWNETLMEVLEQSQKSGKGVIVYFGSHEIGGVVTKITEHTVELKNREYGRIVLRLDRIEGAAGN